MDRKGASRFVGGTENNVLCLASINKPSDLDDALNAILIVKSPQYTIVDEEDEEEGTCYGYDRNMPLECQINDTVFNGISSLLQDTRVREKAEQLVNELVKMLPMFVKEELSLLLSREFVWTWEFTQAITKNPFVLTGITYDPLVGSTHEEVSLNLLSIVGVDRNGRQTQVFSKDMKVGEFLRYQLLKYYKEKKTLRLVDGDDAADSKRCRKGE